MACFFAMVWDPAEAQAARTALRIQNDGALQSARTSRRQPGFFLADLSQARSHARIVEIGGDGAVFGTLFQRSSARAATTCVTAFGENAVSAIVTSSGVSLFSDYWGSYIAFVRSPQGFDLVADPTSSIPCFYLRHETIAVVCSHIELCPAFLRRRLTLNRQFILKLLAYDKIQNGESGLNEVRELPGGCKLSISRNATRETLVWDPRPLARSRDVRSRAEAAEELKQTIYQVVRSWASASPRIALNLSGGLDSAIVAAALTGHSCHADVRALHFVLKGGDPAERVYARELAAAFGLELTELDIDPRHPLPAPDQYPPTARPYREFLGLGLLELQDELPELVGRTTFTGQGGDHLFFETRTPFVFADYVLRKGAGRRSVAELLSAARLSERSVWSVLRHVLPVLLDGGAEHATRFAGIRSRETRVNKQVHEGLDPADVLPDWARTPDGVAPAKFEQVVSLVHLFQIRTGFAPRASGQLLHPLISQPLVELCLKTPTYILCGDGWPRGLARQAMQGIIPDTVRLRRSKGDASRFYIEQLAANHALLSGALLEGALVEGGYVSAGDMKAFLKPGAFRTETLGRMILVYYVIECWIRRWQSELRRI
jgi:asparagine synthase (glutamine-hydrolysing)